MGAGREEKGEGRMERKLVLAEQRDLYCFVKCSITECPTSWFSEDLLELKFPLLPCRYFMAFRVKNHSRTCIFTHLGTPSCARITLGLPLRNPQKVPLSGTGSLSSCPAWLVALISP